MLWSTECKVQDKMSSYILKKSPAISNWHLYTVCTITKAMRIARHNEVVTLVFSTFKEMYNVTT